MKRTILAALLALASIGAMADQTVRGYTRSDGTYVQPHVRSSPNNTTHDNYSTKGNTNPYTGKEGSVDPYRPAAQNNTYSNPYDTQPRHRNGQ